MNMKGMLDNEKTVHCFICFINYDSSDRVDYVFNKLEAFLQTVSQLLLS